MNKKKVGGGVAAAALVAAGALGAIGLDCGGSNPPPPTTIPSTTSTTHAPAPLSCTAFGAPTNTFTLNDVLGSPNQINTDTPLFTLQTDGALAQYTVKVDDTTLPGVYKNYTSATTCIKAPHLEDGTHTISATETTPKLQEVAPYSFLVDTVPPEAPVITSASYSTGFIRVKGTGIATFHISVKEVGQSGTAGASVGSTGLWSASYSRPSGSHDIYAVQSDKAGNQSTKSNIVTVTVP